MLLRSKFFSQYVEKMEKLKLSLSKQHNKMLKNISEMLKIRKNAKIIKLKKIYRENLEFQTFSGFRKVPGIPEKFFENSPVSRVVENSS